MAIDDSRVVQDFIGLIVGLCEDIDLVARAETGADALAQLDAVPIDVVTLDLGLPDISGIDLLDMLVAQDRAGIIILSGRPGSDIDDRYPGIAAFDKLSLFEQRERYLAAIRNAAIRRSPAVRRYS